MNMNIQGLEAEHVSAALCRSMLESAMIAQPDDIGLRRAYHEAIEAEQKTGNDYRRALEALTWICFGPDYANTHHPSLT